MSKTITLDYDEYQKLTLEHVEKEIKIDKMQEALKRSHYVMRTVYSGFYDREDTYTVHEDLAQLLSGIPMKKIRKLRKLGKGRTNG